MAKGWKTVIIPTDLYDFYKELWESQKEDYRREYGVRSFSGLLRAKLWESISYDWKGEYNDNPLIDDWLLGDLDEFIEMNYQDLRRYLKIRNLREFVEDGLVVHIGYCRRILERINKRKPVKTKKETIK